MSSKSKRLRSERKFKSNPSWIREDPTSKISVIVEQNLEFIKEEEQYEGEFILPEQWESDLTLEPCVVKKEIDGIDIGPVKVELEMNRQEMELDSNDSSKYYFRGFSNVTANAKREFFQKFLEAYRESRGLWDIHSADYLDAKRRDEQSVKLLAKYQNYYPDADMKDMQKKINAFKGNYNRELKKLNHFNKSAAGSGREFHSNLWYFDIMSCVCETKESRESLTSYAEKRKLVSKRHREALKRDPIKLEGYRAKAKERARKYRERLLQLSNNDELILEKKEKDRLRQRRYRDRKRKEAQKERNCDPYACKQILGKAVKKAENALPMDLDKKIKIITVLYEKYVRSNK